MYSPQESTQILLFRQKVSNNTITPEELKEALALLRKAREGAHATSAVSRAKKTASKTPVNSDALLGELDGL
jgi:hypothetical protein